jgi:hypothetical protein
MASKRELRALRPEHIDEHQLYSVEQTAAALDLSLARVWQHIAAGRLRTVKDGRRTLVTGRAIRDFVAGLERA